ncbi:MAG: helical backbone metal receptor [Pseudomonadota bacterium]
MRPLALAALALLAACQQGTAGESEASDTNLPRIVSINPCTDAIVAELAAPGQILAISHYSHDPEATSMSLEEARLYPATDGTVEEILALNPDLVIAGGHVGPATVAALEQLGVALVQMPVAMSVDDSHSGIRIIAAALDREPQGEALVARIDAALSAARPENDAPPIAALVWQGGGLVPGENTLIDALLAATGFRNVSSDHGLASWDILPLEPLLADPPEVLLTTASDMVQQDRMLGHPALQRMRGQMVITDFDNRLLFCAGPTIERAAKRLSEVRREVLR